MLKSLNILAPTCHQTSYGESSISLITELTKIGIQVSCFPIGGINNVSLDPKITSNHSIIKESINRGISGYSKDSKSLRLYHAFSMAEHVGRIRCGFPIFELNKFSSIELHNLKQLDHIIVTSEWGKSIVESEVDIPCSIVPLGVDSNIFSPVTRTHKATKFVICGKIEHRKSTREMIEVFDKTFTLDDDVELYLCFANIFQTQQESEEWERFAKSRTIGPKIFPLKRFSSSFDVADLLKSCDCLVSLSKAEGWGLPALQMLSTGGEVISTRNTAQTDFLDDKNSLLIDTPNLEKAWDGKWFHGTGFPGEPGNWHSIGEDQKDQLESYLRTIHLSKQEGTLGINKEGLKTVEAFSWKNSAIKLVEVLEKL